MSVPYTQIKQKAPAASGLGDQIIYYARSVSRGEVDTRQIARDLEKISTLSAADIQAVLYGLEDMMVYYLRNGYIVRLDGMGTYRVGVSSEGLPSPDLVIPANFRKPRILHTPGDELKRMLNNLKYERV